MVALAVLGSAGPTAAVPLRPRTPTLPVELASGPTVALPRVEPIALLPAGPPLARLHTWAAPDATGLRSRGEGPYTPEERARRDAAVDALVAAEAQATEDPETAERPLLAALRGFADVAPLVTGDAQAQEARAFAVLALARTRLVLGKPEDAAAALDEAIVTIRTALPVDQFGPALQQLHDERVAALAPMPAASLTVRCSVPCLVIVDEQPFPSALPPGVHRVWVEALARGLPVLREELRLTPGQAFELVYEVAAPAPDLLPRPVVEEVAPRRILPRWASVLGLAAGAGTAIAGGVLVGVDHRCPDLSNPRQVPCPNILDTDTGGFALLGVGGAVAITAAVILAIDEARARRARVDR
jgi:hypothetical protein